LAILAGYCDPIKEAILNVKFFCGEAYISILAVPKKGALVVAVMNGKHYVASEFCTFMPEGSALVTVDGLNDPRVLEIIIKLRKARHPEDPDLTMPTTNPVKRDGNRENIGLGKSRER